MDEPHEPNPESVAKPRPRWRLAKSAARIVIVLGIVGLATRLTGCVESLAYFPSREAFDTPPGTEDVWFESADGTRLHAWFMPAAGADPAAPGPAILHVHGNAGNIASHESFSRFFTREGFGILLFDYRRYGRSDDTGPLRRRALLADTEAALATLKARSDVDASRVGIYGVSLGGVFALHAAADDPEVRAVATVSAFSTWAGMAHDLVPVLGPVILRGGLEPADAAARLGDRHYLILHGLEDEIVNPRHAELLADAARDAGVQTTLWTDPRGDHNSMVQTNAEARRQLVAFFTKHLGLPSAPPEIQPGTDTEPEPD